jgi:hypothetical protein
VFRPRSALTVIAGLAALGLGCTRVNCSCAAPFDGLYVNVAAPTAGSVVQVCDGPACGSAIVDEIDPGQLRSELKIPAAQLGDWAAHRDAELVVTVRAAEGQAISQATVVATKHHPQCCGDYWDISA